VGAKNSWPNIMLQRWYGGRAFPLPDIYFCLPEIFLACHSSSHFNSGFLFPVYFLWDAQKNPTTNIATNTLPHTSLRSHYKFHFQHYSVGGGI
jgi:hypothetical protein